jgi:hypothetical protein
MKRQQMNDLPPLKTPTLNAQRATRNAQGGRRSGVALVIVLGLLALLMITGVSFTILMRIERSGASNLRHASAARQMAKGGIAYAIAALNHNIGTNRTPGWANRRFITDSPRDDERDEQERDGRVLGNLWIPEDIFISVDESEDNPRSVATARVLSAESAHYLPAALRYRAEVTRKVDKTVDKTYASPEWIPVVSLEAIVGRYAYVVLNTTGLLDANRVNDASTNRWMGSSPTEMRLDPEVQLDVVDAATFASQRTTHGHYETLPELSRLNTGVDGQALANFDVFSYSLPSLIPEIPAILPPDPKAVDAAIAHVLLRTRTQGRRLDIRTETQIKAQATNIKLAFKASGLNDVQKEWAYLGLLDYVDADGEPAGTTDEERLLRPATEAMPLLSSIALRVKYTCTDLEPANPDGNNEHKMEYDFRVIYAYPFQTTTGPFSLDAKINAQNRIDLAEWNPLLPFEDREQVPLAEDFPTCSPGDSPTLRLVDAATGKPPLTKTVTLPKSRGTLPRMAFRVGFHARTRRGSIDLRRLPFLYDKQTPGFYWDVDLTGAELASGAQQIWTEVIDPRFNWEPGPKYWRDSRPGGSTGAETLLDLKTLLPGPGYVPACNLGGLTSLAEYLLRTPEALEHNLFKFITDGVRIGDHVAKNCDSPIAQFRAHVADRPPLSVGELGYLPIGPWLTINLFDHGHSSYNLGGDLNHSLPTIGYHPVLDYFIIGDPNKGKPGLVNLNTVNPEVMGAVFNQLPLQTEDHTPNSPGPVIPATDGGSLDDATEMAEWLVEKGPFQRLSDLGKLFRGTPQLGVSAGNYAEAYPQQLLRKQAADFGEFEREALIRNASELFTLRGQTFTVVLRADAFAPKFGMTGVKQGNVLATATAVAQVWRDTEPMITESRDPINNRLIRTYNYPTFIQFFKILNE